MTIIDLHKKATESLGKSTFKKSSTILLKNGQSFSGILLGFGAHADPSDKRKQLKFLVGPGRYRIVALNEIENF